MMLHHLVLAFFLASVDVESCSFKQLRRRPALPISNALNHNLRLRTQCHPNNRFCQRNLQYVTSKLSIRGGDDENEEYDETMEDFVASFESDLAAIRREAELEAENELQKLRDLVEGRGDLDDKGEISEEYDESDDGSIEHDQVPLTTERNDDQSTENDLIQDEKSEASPSDEEHDEAIEQSEIENDEMLSKEGSTEDMDQSVTEEEEVLPENGTTDANEQTEIEVSETEDETVETNDQSDVESDESTAEDGTVDIVQSEVEDDGVCEEEPISDEDNVIVHSSESDSETVDSVEAVVASPDDATSDDQRSLESKVDQGIKSKQSKKKRKSSKKGRRRKSRKSILEQSELPDKGEIDLGESVMLSQTQDEVAEQPQSGIMFYLRSDLGRALCLFISTVLLAILTQRMQRQMEEEGI